jgi:hypothetical protein
MLLKTFVTDFGLASSAMEMAHALMSRQAIKPPKATNGEMVA